MVLIVVVVFLAIAIARVEMDMRARGRMRGVEWLAVVVECVGRVWYSGCGCYGVEGEEACGSGEGGGGE